MLSRTIAVLTLATFPIACRSDRATSDPDIASRPVEPTIATLLPAETRAAVVLYPSRLLGSPLARSLITSASSDPEWTEVRAVLTTVAACGLELTRVDRAVLGFTADGDWLAVIDNPEYRTPTVDGEDRLACLGAALRVATTGVLDPSLTEGALQIQPGTREAVERLPAYGTVRFDDDARLIAFPPALSDESKRPEVASGGPHASSSLFTHLERASTPCAYASARLPGDKELASASITLECSEADAYPLAIELEFRTASQATSAAAALNAAWPGDAPPLETAVSGSSLRAKVRLDSARLGALILGLITSKE
jgi:hypothetical protein